LSSFISIKSISQIHDYLKLDEPYHPLITHFTNLDIKGGLIPDSSHSISTELYSINLKDGCECSLAYGKRQYKVSEGALVFLAPGQSFFTNKKEINSYPEVNGWNLVFHPDLIRNTTLADNINRYSFFKYNSGESLLLTTEERILLENIIINIKKEYKNGFDGYTNLIISSHLLLFLNYCKRFHARQFNSRSSENRDILVKFENYINDLLTKCQNSQFLTVKKCASDLGLSANYFSDLLKNLTGRSAQEHISFYITEKAKNMLIQNEMNVNEIANFLGFKNPQHFSTFFKNKTGFSPVLYKKSLLM